MTAIRDWGYLLDDLCTRVTGVIHALAVSGDGLKIAVSSRLEVENADQLAAFTSGLSSLTSAAAGIMEGGVVEHNVTEMTNGYLIVMRIDQQSILTVLAAKTCDLGQVTYEMAMLIERIADAITPDVRQPQRA